MVDWYVDPGLARFINQWTALHPGAVVGTIGDRHHRPPSSHLPEADGSVDAGDVMPGAGGVTAQVLDDLAETLRLNRDSRIAYVIRRQRIFYGRTGPDPFTWGPYGGDYHGHLHLNVGDAHEGQAPRDWDLTAPEGEDDMATPGEIANAVWAAESAEYFDADADGVRQKRTRVDVLHRAEAAAQRADDAANAAVTASQRAAGFAEQAATDTASIRATLDEILRRLPPAPEA
jgi:hypothetical protein